MKIFTLGNKRVAVKKEIVVPLFMLVFTIIYFAESYGLSAHSLAFPRMFLSVLLLTSILVIKSCISVLASDSKASESAPLFSRKLIEFFIVLLAFTFSIAYIGIYAGIMLFLVIAMLVLGVREIRTLIAAPLVLTAVIHLVFPVLLQTPLPVGSLFETIL